MATTQMTDGVTFTDLEPLARKLIRREIKGLTKDELAEEAESLAYSLAWLCEERIEDIRAQYEL